ncbi:gag-polypeptide of LTR copia-type [Carex littledalei]|uniref:Gag-polypeptide of LTR copia-type n=1 Tax=Carex littledalei TaxID=544730 RepID=A0A833QJY4_9POAL|nr:gag-polypeptide of LTR copia-type [Carex littledalei]
MPLNGKNYIPWAKAARVTLRAKGLLGYVNGNKKKPKECTDAQEEWDMIDSQAMTLITNSIEPQLSTSFWTCETATELWQAIEKQYSDQKSHSQIFQLKNEIAKITQESRDIPELIGHIIAKYEELKLYRPPTTDLTVLQEREEWTKYTPFWQPSTLAMKLFELRFFSPLKN